MPDCEYCGMGLEAGSERYVEKAVEMDLLSMLHVACPECATAFDTVYQVG